MMNTFKDAIVTTEQYKFIKQGIVNAARMSLSARNLIGIRRPPLGLGVQTFSHDELTEMGTAMLSYNFVEQLEGTNLTRTNTNIPIHQEDFFIGERDHITRVQPRELWVGFIPNQSRLPSMPAGEVAADKVRGCVVEHDV